MGDNRNVQRRRDGLPRKLYELCSLTQGLANIVMVIQTPPGMIQGHDTLVFCTAETMPDIRNLKDSSRCKVTYLEDYQTTADARADGGAVATRETWHDYDEIKKPCDEAEQATPSKRRRGSHYQDDSASEQDSPRKAQKTATKESKGVTTPPYTDQESSPPSLHSTSSTRRTNGCPSTPLASRSRVLGDEEDNDGVILRNFWDADD